jgi:hypothetical protein
MTDTAILHEAEQELWEAVAYYESRAPGLGLDFQAEMAASAHARGSRRCRRSLIIFLTRRREG